MLESLRVQNFQKHKDLAVEFGRVTTVVGPSRAGKSSLLRALRWACHNRPGGDRYLRHGAQFCEVALQADGHEVSRARGPGSNDYHLDGDLFQAFGQGVPGRVTDLINLDPDLNWQGQHDSPYWLSKSPGEVARELNRVVALDLIDSTLAALAAEERKAQATVDLTRDRYRKAREERDRLAWVKEASVKIGKLDKIEKTLEETQESARRLRRLIEEGEGYTETVARASRGYSAAAIGIRKLDAREESLSEIIRNRKVLADLIETAERLEGDACRAKAEVSRLEKAWEKLAGTPCPLCGSPIPSATS